MVTMAERVAKIETKIESIDSKIDNMMCSLREQEQRFVFRREFWIIISILGAVGSILLITAVNFILSSLTRGGL